MQKKSIYVAYTGGTIGMQRSEQGYIPVSGHLQRQLALMPEFHRPEMPDFTIHEYAPLMVLTRLPHPTLHHCWKPGSTFVGWELRPHLTVQVS